MSSRAVSRPSDLYQGNAFGVALALALGLHIGGLYVWHLMPKTQVVDIPVTALNIKLGDGDMQFDPPPSSTPANTAEVEDTISRLVRDTQFVQPDRPQGRAAQRAMERAATNAAAASKALDKAISGSPNNMPARQFVRTPEAEADTAELPKGPGSPVGNSTARDAELISRYEQLISGWIQKFKLYPEAARVQGMQGETMVRIRIDRKGNVRYYALEYTTGYPLLDRAAIDMIRRANPVPAAPVDYPDDELTEFLIPVSFKLQ